MDYKDVEIPTPYKGLNFYSQTDNQFFFGRETDQQIVIQNLWASRLTVIYGASGVGKSSLLRAGVAYRLRQAAEENLKKTDKPGWCVVVFPPQKKESNDSVSWKYRRADVEEHLEEEITNIFDNKLHSEIKQKFKREIKAITQNKKQHSLSDILRAWLNIISLKNDIGTLFIILDQFEDFFGLEDGDKKIFAQELSKVVNDSELNIHFLISIREDDLAKLDYFKGLIFRNLLDNRIHLKHLNKKSAKDAIKKPIDEYNKLIRNYQKDKHLSSIEDITIDENLVNKILQDTAISGSDDSYETPYIQLVMLRLWKEEMTVKSPSRKLQTQTYTNLGGAEQIVQDHLEQKLEELKNDIKIEPETSYRLFNYLVTPSGKKLELNVKDLTGYVQGELNATEELDEKKVKRWLTKLSEGEARILRPLADEYYEIFFKILVQAISKQLQRQHKIKEIEQIAKNALLQFESSQLDALLTAMQTGQKFQEDIEKGHLKDYYAPQLKTTLQNILDNIREENQFKAHEKPIYSVCFSPDGKYFATGSVDGTACLWDLKGNRIGEPFPHGDDNWVWSVCFSPDGQQLATGSTDGTVRRWDLQGNPIGNFQVCEPSQGHDSWVLSVRFSPDGKQLATGSADGTVRLWDLQGNPIVKYFSHNGRVWSVCFSPDGHQLAAGCADGIVRRWDWKSNKQMENPPVEHRDRGTIYDISFSPDEKYLAAASSNGKAYVWDLESKSDQPIECQGHQCWVYSVSFSHDSKYLATGSADGTVRLWDLKDKQIARDLQDKQIAKFKQIAEFKDHKGFVWSVSFSHDGHLATSSTDGTVRLWRLTDNQRAKFSCHKGWVYSVSFSPDGQQLATGSADGTVCLWDLQGNQIGESFSVNNPVLSVAFSPDGKKLATGSEDGIPRLWDLQGNLLQKCPEHQHHKDWVWSVDFNFPNGQYLATGSADGTAYLWDLHSNTEIKKLDHHNNAVWSVSFSPDGQYLATGSINGLVSLWDLEGNLQKKFHVHNDWIWSVSFSPDGQYLATGSINGLVSLRDLEGNLQKEFQGHNDWIWSVNFSPDGQYLATGSADGTACLWDLKGQLVQEFKDHKGAVYSVSFSTDGKQLATASTNGTVKLWSIEYDLEPILTKGRNWLKDYFVNHPEKKHVLKICCDS